MKQINKMRLWIMRKLYWFIQLICPHNWKVTTARQETIRMNRKHGKGWLGIVTGYRKCKTCGKFERLI